MWDRSKREETEGNEQRIVIKQEIEEFKWRTSREKEREREREERENNDNKWYII